ncbi:Beta-hexosaminidase, partial [Lachnellula cervina]
AVGQQFMLGWDGTQVTPSIRKLIEEQHIGSILLTAKNLTSADQTIRLVHELQTIAYEAGHPVPLSIALDQENGGVNSLCDTDCITQFPSAMGVAATGSSEVAFQVAKATALEISAAGINLILGPVLDVLANARNQPLGVRSTGDDPQVVSQFGVSYVKGYKEAGIATCGKHFPSYGNLEFIGSGAGSGIPIITETLEQLSLSALVPFRSAIASGLDAMMVGGCALVGSGTNVMHACLSGQVVDELLRKDLNFQGVVISACLRMEALIQNIGVGGGTVMAIRAGCDIVVLCRTSAVQHEAIAGLKLAIKEGIIPKERIRTSLKRILQMKSKCTSWEQALSPLGLDYLADVKRSHTELARATYQNSISLLRDEKHLLPLSNIIQDSESLLLLTPLLTTTSPKGNTPGSTAVCSPIQDVPHHSPSLISGEELFSTLGTTLARRRNGKVLHTSYTANGVELLHENLLNRASAVIVITADANRNHYQIGFTRHIAMVCNSRPISNLKRKTPLIVVSVSSPYDFAIDQSVGTYICTYDFTDIAMNALVSVLCGDEIPRGVLPGAPNKLQKATKVRQYWPVEDFDRARDEFALGLLIKAIVEGMPQHRRSQLQETTPTSFLLQNSRIEESHLVVRNSTTQEIYGFCSTYFFKESATAVIGALFVHGMRRNLSIGHSLHERAKRVLLGKPGVKSVQIGSILPSMFMGIPADDAGKHRRLSRWFLDRGWKRSSAGLAHSMIIRDLSRWSPSAKLTDNAQTSSVAYDALPSTSYSDLILEHVRANSSQNEIELYKLALADPRAYQVVLAKSFPSNKILGCGIICYGRSSLAEFLPVLRTTRDGGGILAPVISLSNENYVPILQGLLICGIRRIKAQGLNCCVLNKIEGDIEFTAVSTLGFSTIHSFERWTWPMASMP